MLDLWQITNLQTTRIWHVEMTYASMTHLGKFRFALITAIAISLSTPALSKFQPKSINGTSVCVVGQPLVLSAVNGLSTGSCVPSSVSCAFTCQRNSPNCTCFNYYTNGSCEFFNGSSVNVSYQQGCTLWAVNIYNCALWMRTIILWSLSVIIRFESYPSI